MEIIPAIDIIEGACVRLTRGDFDSKRVYDQDPLEVAKRFEDAGCRRLHLVDLDGARAGTAVNLKVLERIASHTRLVVDYGGGIKEEEDLQRAFLAGASMVTGGSIAVKRPDAFLFWVNTYGADRIILGADARDGYISVSGWKETSGLEVSEFILSFLRRGVKKVISTDIAQDGMMEGPSLELYRRIMEKGSKAGLDIELIASGGVAAEKDLEDLQNLGVSGVIIGKALYEGTIALEGLHKWIE